MAFGAFLFAYIINTHAGFILLSAIVINAGQYVIEKGIRCAILLTKTAINTKTAGNNNDTD